MQLLPYTAWPDEDAWLGYLDAFPRFWTQGETREDLEEHLRDLQADLTGGHIPGVGGS